MRSPYPDVEIPDVSLTEFLFADGFGDRADAPAFLDGTSERQLTFAQFADYVEKIAAGLAERGISDGDVVALFAPNLPEWAALFHGILRANAIVTSANSMYTSGELAHQLARLRRHDADHRVDVPGPGRCPGPRRPGSRRTGSSRSTPTEGHDVAGRPAGARRPPRPLRTGRPTTPPCCPTRRAPPAWPRA